MVYRNGGSVCIGSSTIERRETMKNHCRRIEIVLLLLAVGSGRAGAQILTTLWQFGGNPSNGANPEAGLVQGTDGNFYGTSYSGGTNGLGTVFRISSAGTLVLLWQFGTSPSNGANPDAGLVQGRDGSFYGTTQNGGTNSAGTVFRITTNGSLTTLWQFGIGVTNGVNPEAGLMQAIDGNLYGTTIGGGTNGNGTVFRITTNGNLTTLYQFGGYFTNSVQPQAGLVQGNDSNLYGTTIGGGTNDDGTVFRITTNGNLTTLWQFGSGPTNGIGPSGGLIMGADGNLYGATVAGGTNNDGTVFRITTNGNLTTLWQFGVVAANGVNPSGNLLQGSDSNFYGTAGGGGTNNAGTVFRISSEGTFTTLWQFGRNATNGLVPGAGLVQGSDGDFYGTTTGGGTNSEGSVFKLIVPLSPPANQISAIHPSGTNIVIGIPSVAGESYQLQFSSSMNPTNWSNISGAFVSNSIGALLTLTNFGGAVGPQGFYRFAVTP
jgi:uncharacterized repeat protein (TIGR03803 family)